MSYGFCNNEREHQREGRQDFERNGRYGYDTWKYNDPFNDCNRAYTDGFDEARREDDRRQEMREEEEAEQRRYERRLQEQREEMRQQEEDEYNREWERQQHEQYMQNIGEAEVCGECGGYGKLSVTLEGGEVYEGKCPVCGGFGYHESEPGETEEMHI